MSGLEPPLIWTFWSEKLGILEAMGQHKGVAQFDWLWPQSKLQHASFLPQTYFEWKINADDRFGCIQIWLSKRPGIAGAVPSPPCQKAVQRDNDWGMEAFTRFDWSAVLSLCLNLFPFSSSVSRLFDVAWMNALKVINDFVIVAWQYYQSSRTAKVLYQSSSYHQFYFMRNVFLSCDNYVNSTTLFL